MDREPKTQVRASCRVASAVAVLQHSNMILQPLLYAFACGLLSPCHFQYVACSHSQQQQAAVQLQNRPLSHVCSGSDTVQSVSCHSCRAVVHLLVESVYRGHTIQKPGMQAKMQF
eukprot:GHUV01038212.1.p1 GENE.GHUV01038212.1~~GHUV01038212.1.p1  ORF type:complete len:115 (+),score=5.85 GHUV01038212.1:520-864(+)